MILPFLTSLHRISGTNAVPQALPPAPQFVVGRDTTINSIASNASSHPPRIAILGPGGIGKTTLAMMLLHNHILRASYPTRFFLSCEPTPTADILENTLADVLHIPKSDRNSNLQSHILDQLRHFSPVMLCLDNLETVWDVETEQPKVDAILDVFSSLGSALALIVTMRGTQAPKTSFEWIRTPLTGLGLKDATLMYEAVSKQSTSSDAATLLGKLGGIPLAIKLLGRMVDEGDQPTHLLASWATHGTTVLESGGTHRLSSLDRSIRLSVFGPRVNDSARLLLGLLARLPDGLSNTSDWLGRVRSAFQLPGSQTLELSIRSLRRAALITERGNPSRFQMLQPVQEFCQKFVELPKEALDTLIEVYFDLVRKNYNRSDRQSRELIRPEMANIRALLLYSASTTTPSPQIVNVAVVYCSWCRWFAIGDVVGVEHVMDLLGPRISSLDQASLLRSLGQLETRLNQPEAAEKYLQRALEIFSQLDNLEGMSHIYRSVGNLQMDMNRLDAAEDSFQSALKLSSKDISPLAYANTQYCLGDLQIRKGQYDNAIEHLQSALQIYSVEEHDTLGSANCLLLLGELGLRINQLQAAEKSLTDALKLYDELEHPQSSARTYQLLGEVFYTQNDVERAESHFREAIRAYTSAGNSGQADDCLYRVGQVWVKQGKVEEAKAEDIHVLRQLL
ncbi:hypothetical protein DL96DRAFT_13029 [Flagelloscypha sp. PMI_526]|nr:hypothetical protein DL96DRAFT_13029 [Flagelloscypha sp. PMI_526]